MQIVRIVPEKIKYYVFCNERCRIIVRTDQQGSIKIVYLYIYIRTDTTPLLCINRYVQSRRIIEGRVDSAFVP